MPTLLFGIPVNSLLIFNGKVAVSVFGVFLVNVDMGCVLQHSVTTLWSLDNISLLVPENRTNMDVGIPRSFAMGQVSVDYYSKRGNRHNRRRLT